MLLLEHARMAGSVQALSLTYIEGQWCMSQGSRALPQYVVTQCRYGAWFADFCLLAGSNIATDAEAVRLNLRELASEQLPPEVQSGGRTEVLPVQWRKHLNLEVRLCPQEQGSSHAGSHAAPC